MQRLKHDPVGNPWLFFLDPSLDTICFLVLKTWCLVPQYATGKGHQLLKEARQSWRSARAK
jgi:hypothetical protein